LIRISGILTPNMFTLFSWLLEPLCSERTFVFRKNQVEKHCSGPTLLSHFIIAAFFSDSLEQMMVHEQQKIPSITTRETFSETERRRKRGGAVNAIRSMTQLFQHLRKFAEGPRQFFGGFFFSKSNYIFAIFSPILF
jgi:hypothetical protein